MEYFSDSTEDGMAVTSERLGVIACMGDKFFSSHTWLLSCTHI